MTTEDNWIYLVESAAKTAKSIGIENLVIEPGRIRGMDTYKTVILFQDENIPEFEFGSIGLSDTDLFLARFELISTQEDVKYTAVPKEIDMEQQMELFGDDAPEPIEWVSNIVMKSPVTTIEYKCSDPNTIRAPKKVNDETTYRALLPIEAALQIKKAYVAMKTEIMEFSADESGVYYRMVDINGDEFKHRFADFAENLTEDADANFKYKYPVKTILSIFKGNNDAVLEIGGKGILTSSLNGFKVLILPQV